MKPLVQRVLDFAAARAREAEVVYKNWARAAHAEASRSLFAELGAAERGHWELLAHITPADLPASDPGATDFGMGNSKMTKSLPSLPSSEGLKIAVEREVACAAIYERLAALGGETATLFRSLAEEERSHGKRIEAMLDPESTSRA